MIFLISLALTALFIRFCAKSLRAHPVPYYWGAVIIAAAVVLCTVNGVVFPGWFLLYLNRLCPRNAKKHELFHKTTIRRFIQFQL